MSTYAVTLDCEHGTSPALLWRVLISNLETVGDISEDRHTLWVPFRDAWMLDTLRMVLHELAAYLPAHEPADAMVTIHAKRLPPRGRRRHDGAIRTPRFDHDSVSLSVAARGWRAEVKTWTTDHQPDEGERRQYGEPFTEPMQAVLLDLAARSPFPLASVALVPSAYLGTTSRRDERRRRAEEAKDPSTTLHKITRTLEDLSYVAPQIVNAVNIILDQWREKYDVD